MASTQEEAAVNQTPDDKTESQKNCRAELPVLESESAGKSIGRKFPDIGHEIEEFVAANNIGADKWRQSGLLTFDGNIN